MPTMLEAARALLATRRFALAGASRDPKDFSRVVLRELLARGYDVVPVNPAGGEIEGRTCAPSVGAIVPAVEGVIFMTPPARSAEAAREALRAGARRLWFHRGAGPGSASPEALAACAEAGVTPIQGLCPFMALPDAGWAHRLHGWLRRGEAHRPCAMA
jgi:predicted CoA-binding protein